MDLESVPTIESLLKQRAICFTGHQDLIDRYIDLITPNDGLALFDGPIDIASSLRLARNNSSLDELWQSCPIFDPETNESKVLRYSEQSDSKQIQVDSCQSSPLYTVYLGGDFIVTAHVRTHNGYFNKIIHQKIGVNPKRLTHSLNAITRVIDQSPVFFICAKCNKLIDANFKSQDNPFVCAYDACGKLVEQNFSVVSDSVSSHLYSSNVRVDKFADYIAISVRILQWTHPHEAHFEWVIERKMHLNSTPRQVKSAAKQIHDSKIYSGTCKHCNQSMNIGHMWKDDICQSCASGIYGVMF